jgi:hypothetical protein
MLVPFIGAAAAWLTLAIQEHRRWVRHMDFFVQEFHIPGVRTRRLAVKKSIPGWRAVPFIGAGIEGVRLVIAYLFGPSVLASDEVPSSLWTLGALVVASIGIYVVSFIIARREVQLAHHRKGVIVLLIRQAQTMSTAVSHQVWRRQYIDVQNMAFHVLQREFGINTASKFLRHTVANPGPLTNKPIIEALVDIYNIEVVPVLTDQTSLMRMAGGSGD